MTCDPRFDTHCSGMGHAASPCRSAECVFFTSRHNYRTDEYGGDLANRVRLLRELNEETKEVVGADCSHTR